ncbi:MBL fold metallo-hydrolase [bacterium]|nr:MBL fold metallo-hydrolase [bacterium]MBU1985454.1 MBL fold metallo-hydrolase [bacterium]
MKICFHGAAGEVTGSQHLLHCHGRRVLLDCGLFQGRREETYRKNRHPSYDPQSLDAVVLSHAHLDHSGLLPRLAGLGFRGSVHCTPITAELCDPMLRDSAFVQEKDVEFVNKLHRRKGLPAFNVLYGLDDVEQLLTQLSPHPLHSPCEVAPGVTATFLEAGHVLGSAQVLLEIEGRGRRLRVGFTGDLGRRNLPLLKDPEQLSDLDVLIIESTYGNRDHDPMSETGPELSEVIRTTYAKGGKVIIPAFALERTQELLFLLAVMHASGDLPSDMPVHVDSPLATKCTDVFSKHLQVYDQKTRKLIREGTNPFEFPGLHFTSSVEESKALNVTGQPMIIISASGMMEAGRILHHLRNNIEDSRNTILVVSYQAEHTLGRRIADRRPEVRIFGEPHKLRARVKILNTFSGHAGREDLLAYAKSVVDSSPRLKKVFVVHGEESQTSALMETFRSWNSFECIYPKRGEMFEL